MKTREKRIIVSLAFVFALGLGTQALALDELTANNNDVVLADDTATAVNDSTIDNSSGKTVIPIKVEDSLNDNSKNVDIDKAKVGGNGNAANDDSTITTTDNSDKQKVDNKGNAANDGSTAVAVNDSLNGNTTKLASENNNSNQDNSVGKTQVAVEVEDSFNDKSDNSDTAKAGDNGIALVDSAGAIITKDAFNGNIGEVEGKSVAATNGSTASMTDSNNTDNSVNTTAKNGGIAINASGGDSSTNTNTVIVTEDSFNNKAEDGGVAIYGDNSAEVEVASHNTVDSYNDTATITVGNVDIKVASSVLAGEVSGNNLTVPEGQALTTGANTIDGASVIATGITVISQNTGVLNQVQQAVTVQYNQTP